MNELQTGIIALVKSALTGEKVDIPENFDWDVVFKTAKRHQIVPMIYYGVQYSNITLPSEIMQRLELATFKNIAVSQNQLYMLKQIYKAFDEKGIDYMPLKGAVLKYLYPKPEMRPMGDADILIKQEQYDQVRHIMTDLGFDEMLESDHELVWDKNGILHVELHKRLIPSYNKDYYAYYGEGWQFAKYKKNSCYNMKDEDSYIYLFTHYAKHYRGAGIGIRHITDLYIFSTLHPKLDYNYIEYELKKLQLREFYKNTKHTIDVWFCKCTSDNMSDFITSKIFDSGSYGTYSTHLLSVAVKLSGTKSNEQLIRKKVIINRMFPPCRIMISRYKCLKKHPSLLPLMWIVRFLQLPFRLGSIKRNIRDVKTTAPDNVIAYRNELEYVGLKYNFKV